MANTRAYTLDTLTDRVIWCIINVHQTLGPGFSESVYRNALVIELAKRSLTANVEYYVEVAYEGNPVGSHFLDLLVEGQLIVEVKTVEAIGKAHYAQVRSYLKATRLQRALLVNFARDRADFRRVEARNDGNRRSGDVNSGDGGDSASSPRLVERRNDDDGDRGM